MAERGSAVRTSGTGVAGARTGAATAGPAAAVSAPRRPKSRQPGGHALALIFLAPGLILLGALVAYPIIFTFVRSFYDATGNAFVGIGNYKQMFTSADTLTAIKNNVIWVVIAPTLVTAAGLVFAVLTERIRFATAFKVAVFMPMAISFLSAGVIWRLVYQDDPKLGLANAATVGIVNVFRPPGDFAGGRPSQPDDFRPAGNGWVSTDTYSPGDTVQVGVIGLRADRLPPDLPNAKPPQAVGPNTLTGTVWLDFQVGGGGSRGVIDPRDKGLPSFKVDLLQNGEVVKSTRTAEDGSFAIGGLGAGDYHLALSDANFRPAFGGILWLGPALVTPAVIVSYIWIWAGFAMVLIAAGLAAIPRDVLEAARVDGASEWQVFRRVTAPLLAPVLAVVFVTLVINVLKVFDLVLVVPPGSVQNNANVLALEMWRVSFGGGQNQGLGSALAVLLFVLVIPAMAFNIRRFRGEQ